jgi:hypothetical protein
MLLVVALTLLLSSVIAVAFSDWWQGIAVRSCLCGAHWWVRRWYFIWRHMDASPFNDQLQNRWTVWMFEFRKVLKLSASELLVMGYAGSSTWKRSRWQLSPSPSSYCVRCARHSW